MRGISIHVGVNRPATMSGHPLSQSEENAWRMAELAFQAGYQSIHVLRGREATRQAVGTLLADAAHAIRTGDTLFVSFCGHGSRVRDQDGDERDGQDETWCLHDADLVDDELAGYWRLLPAGARALVVTESCFGGGSGRLGDEAVAQYKARPAAPRQPVYRSAGLEAWRGVEQAAQPPSSCIARAPDHTDGIRASVLVLAAASEDRHAQEGVYARHLLEVWEGGAFRGSFCDLHRALCERVGCEMQAHPQDPQILMLGAADPSFPLEVAFHLDRPAMRGRGGDF
jgi:hypothetical protein